MCVDNPSTADGDKSGHKHFVEEFDGAAKTYGTGTSFMATFDSDKFANEHTDNPYYPFSSRAEWELGAFLLRSSLSMADINAFLSLTLVR
jgi:hypothetical protein